MQCVRAERGVGGGAGLADVAGADLLPPSMGMGRAPGDWSRHLALQIPGKVILQKEKARHAAPSVLEQRIPSARLRMNSWMCCHGNAGRSLCRSQNFSGCRRRKRRSLMRTRAPPADVAKARTQASLWAAWSSPRRPLNPLSSTQAQSEPPLTHCPANQPPRQQSLQLRILPNFLFPYTCPLRYHSSSFVQPFFCSNMKTKPHVLMPLTLSTYLSNHEHLVSSFPEPSGALHKPHSLLFIIFPQTLTHSPNNKCISTNSPVSPMSFSGPSLYILSTLLHQPAPDTAAVQSDATVLNRWCLFFRCLYIFWICLNLFLQLCQSFCVLVKSLCLKL